MNKTLLTNENFNEINWHDNAIHGFEIIESEDGCSGGLNLDIDYIVEWIEPVDNKFSFRLVPSNLLFHEVTNLIISINYAAASAAVQPITIHEIHRDVFSSPNGYSSYIWKIEINWPSNSFISFRSSGFSQTSRKEPITSGCQYLSVSER